MPQPFASSKKHVLPKGCRPSYRPLVKWNPCCVRRPKQPAVRPTPLVVNQLVIAVWNIMKSVNIMDNLLNSWDIYGQIVLPTGERLKNPSYTQWRCHRCPTFCGARCGFTGRRSASVSYLAVWARLDASARCQNGWEKTGSKKMVPVGMAFFNFGWLFCCSDFVDVLFPMFGCFVSDFWKYPMLKRRIGNLWQNLAVKWDKPSYPICHHVGHDQQKWSRAWFCAQTVVVLHSFAALSW